jgi:long-chain acyl-CoA synthetase
MEDRLRMDVSTAVAGRDLTVVDLIRRHAVDRPDAIALEFGERVTRYDELDRVSDRVAASLSARGLRAGDRAAYLGKNSDHYFAILLGAMKARVVLVPINWRLAAEEIEYLLADSTPVLLFFSGEFAATATALISGALDLHLVALDHAQAMAEVEPFAGFLEAGAERGVEARPEVDDTVLVIYTSGTTGRPKGAMLTHRSLLRYDRGRIPEDPGWFSWHCGETALLAMPIFHIGGTGQGLRALRGGSRVIVRREFNVDDALAAIETLRVQKLFLVPAALEALVRHPRIRSADVSSLECVLYGAAAIADDLLEESIEVLDCGFVQMYGMTETSGTVTALSPADHVAADRERRRSVGRPLPGVDIAIVDRAGDSLPVGTIGEIAVRSSANMRGYWNRPDATRDAYTASGFLRTGDAGRLDAAGYLYMADRIKDMINSGGENVYPAEVERVLSGHPAIADLAVIGVPSARWGEEVKAIVVLRVGASADADSILSWARERLAAYKLPKSIAFVAELPRSASGKLLRRELRDRFAPAGSM